ncbi:MAG: hypothetical protein ACM3O3_09390 [Syntrophothermus sp.]
MNKFVFILGFLLSLIVVSCSNDNVVSPTENSTGSISLIFDKTTIPSDVTHVKLNLVREGYNTIQRIMDLTSDTTAELNINKIEVGTWFLKVAAFGEQNDTLYYGETQVIITESNTTIVNLRLNPVDHGKYGNIKIFVTWGTFPIPTCHWVDCGPIMGGGLPGQANGVFDPNIIYEDGIYKMWYAGINNSAKCFIFYATSTDGINWEKKYEPILTPNININWASYSVNTPKVIKVNGTYKMYFTGWADPSGHWNIGLATSSDGINWTMNTTPVLQGTSGDKYQLVPGDIVMYNGKYYLYYMGRNFPSMKIYLATSTDGINFTTNNTPVITPTYSWEGNSIYQPTLIYDECKFKMVYIDYDNTENLGYAESIDGINWEKQENPIFNTYDFKNHWASDVFDINFRKINNEYKIWYGSESYRIGLLTSNN